MEERRTTVSVFMLFLVLGMLAEQSRAEKSEFDKCYDLCFTDCYAYSLGSYSLQSSCSNCYDSCELKIEGKACILFWCWKIK